MGTTTMVAFSVPVIPSGYEAAIGFSDDCLLFMLGGPEGRERGEARMKFVSDAKSARSTMWKCIFADKPR